MGLQVIWAGVCEPLKEKELRGKKLQKGLRIWMTRLSYSKVPKGTVSRYKVHFKTLVGIPYELGRPEADYSGGSGGGAPH